MLIKDEVFGELEYDYGWSREITIGFCGKESEIDLLVHAEEDGKFTESQYEAYQYLMKDWEKITRSILQPILDYYNEERYNLGYDTEYNEEYPMIETVEQLLEMIDLDAITVPDWDFFDGRSIGLSFYCSWDTENGLGVRLLNEEVSVIGYQDVTI
jgi:hypothetical protein